MPRPRTPLPVELTGRPFLLTDPRAAGVTLKRSRAADLLTPTRGIRWPVGVPVDPVDHAALVLQLIPDAWLSHHSAAALYGLSLPPRLQADRLLHLSREGRWGPPRRKGVHGHAVRVREQEIITHRGLRVARPSRVWFDLLPLLTKSEAVVVGDQLVRHPRPDLEHRDAAWCIVEELAASLQLNEYRIGVRRGREALPLIRVGSDSAPETLLRLAIGDAGLPEPELQIRLTPGGLQGDLGYRRQRLVLQYEGAHHLTREQQTADIRRDQLWQDAGWQVLRCDVTDLRQGFARALGWLRRRL